MHVIWKRPDGFHGAVPSDFFVVEIAGQMRIWLHKSEHEWFPFQISGGWQDALSTRKLNLLVNLLAADYTAWITHLLKIFRDSMTEDPAVFFDETTTWLDKAVFNLKGDVWEVEIMEKIIAEIRSRLISARKSFEQQAGVS